MDNDSQLIFESYINKKMRPLVEHSESNKEMSLQQLEAISKKVQDLKDKITNGFPDDNLEPWVFAKIVRADQEINSIHDYIDTCCNTSSSEEPVSAEMPNTMEDDEDNTEEWLARRDAAIKASIAAHHPAHKGSEDGESFPMHEGVKVTKKRPQYKGAREGKDIGKKGKNFQWIAKSAGKKYHSKEAGKRVAGAVLAKMRRS